MVGFPDGAGSELGSPSWCQGLGRDVPGGDVPTVLLVRLGRGPLENIAVRCCRPLCCRTTSLRIGAGTGLTGCGCPPPSLVRGCPARLLNVSENRKRITVFLPVRAACWKAFL